MNFVSVQRSNAGVEDHEGPGLALLARFGPSTTLALCPKKGEVKAEAKGCKGHISDRRLLFQSLRQPGQASNLRLTFLEVAIPNRVIPPLCVLVPADMG